MDSHNTSLFPFPNIKMQQKEISELKKKIAARKVKGKKGQKLRKKLNTAATTT